jgi:hypothetical protein
MARPALALADRLALRSFVYNQLRPQLPDAPSVFDERLAQIKRLINEQPELYGRTVQLLCEGLSPKKVAALSGLELETVRRIRSYHPEAIAAAQAQTIQHLREGALSASERMLETLDEIPPEKLAITLGILVDKLQLLTGGATQRTEHRNVPTPEDLQALFDALPSANPPQPEGHNPSP